MYKRIRGTQDFLDLSLYNVVIDSVKKLLQIYNFTEIATPILESRDLYIRSLGTETDVVSKQMFMIETGEDDEKICLRPEATASIVRAFNEAHIQRTPWKIWTLGPMFRYERPQKGRYRQFHQVNIEVIGAASIMQDIVVIKMLDRLFSESLKLEDYALGLNFIGCADDRRAYEQKLYLFLQGVEAKLCEKCLRRKEKNILRVFDCKNKRCQEVYQDAPHVTDSLCDACNDEWKTLQDGLQMLGVSFSHIPTLVRGLDYYSKTVFEFTSHLLGAQNAFCGGGRYDTLVEQLGGDKDQPGIGAGIGIERVLLVLEQQNKRQAPELPPLVCVIPLTEHQRALALLVGDELQAHDMRTEIFFETASLKSLMRRADKWGARFVALLGDSEQESKAVTVRDMATGASETILQTDLVVYIRGVLSAASLS